MNEFFLPVANFSGFLPLYLLAVLGIAAVLIDAFLAPERSKSWITAFGICAAGISLLMVLLGANEPDATAFAKAPADGSAMLALEGGAYSIQPVSFHGEAVGAMDAGRPAASMIALDHFTRPVLAIVFLVGFLVMLLGRDLVRRRNIAAGEFVALGLFAVVGGAFLAISRELLVVFLSIEILSICLYVMIAMDRSNRRSGEAAMKYFILGSFASAIMVLGIGFLFGAVGSTYFEDLHAAVANGGVKNTAFLLIGIALIFGALCFKLALAPFHMYAPDVYQGSSAVVAGLVATVAKIAGFAVLARLAVILAQWPNEHAARFADVLWLIAALSIIVGNVGGILQTNIKRMLGYSSIAHSGYLLLAILAIYSAVAADNYVLAMNAQRALLVYLVGYTAMNMLAFGAVGSLGPSGEEDISGIAGLARRQPIVAAGLALAMVSLTGIPPTIGFFGKYLVFSAAVQAGYVKLAILAILFSIMSAFYYLRVVVAMYMRPAENDVELEKPSAAGAFALALSAAIVLILGAFPNLLLDRLM